MRKLAPVHFAASLVIAVCGAPAVAATGSVAPVAGGNTAARAAAVPTASSSPSVNPNAPLVSSGNSGSSSTGTSTSSSGLATSGSGASANPTAGQSSGSTITGTSTGDVFSGSSRGNAPPVGPASVNSPTTDTFATATNNAFVGSGVVITNGVTPSDMGVNANGELVGNPAANVNTSIAPNAIPDAGRIGAVVAPELDQAARREVQRERNVAARKGQRLYSITPRTSVDRTDQMPDDPKMPTR